MKRLLVERYKAMSANQVVGFWLAVWWVINLIVSGASELADDEAYYHIFAQNLAWGYFDHPPMTALLVWLGEHIFSGELGVRFFFTLLQPLYLYIFWVVLRDSLRRKSGEVVERKSGELYVMISASMLILQLYGLIAVPDGPLMFFTALFLLSFKRFTESHRLAWLAVGVTLGLLALSKYHGALVLLFALLANVGWFIRNPRKIGELALSGVVALAIITPHLLWQKEHDWVSFAYHLSDRNGTFSISNITDFVVNILVVFSPFFLPLWVQSMRKVRAESPITRVLKLYPAAFFLFFGLSSFRGYVQPQWTIVATYGLVWLLWAYAEQHLRTRRYVMRMGWVTTVLVLIVKFILIFNPIGLRVEVFNNESSYSQIAQEVGNRPLIIDTRYTKAAKYDFYTQGDVYCQSNISHRTSEWEYLNDDDSFIGREVVVEADPANYSPQEQAERMKTIELSDGKVFNYVVVDDFRPVRKVEIEAVEFDLPETMTAGDRVSAKLKIYNPYPYDIVVDGYTHKLVACWRWRTPRCSYFPLAQDFTVRAGETVEVECEVIVPDVEKLPAQRYKMGFAIRHCDMPTWYNSDIFVTEVIEN